VQCRERWRNHLRPDLNKGDWTEKEDVEIWNRVHQMGTKCAAVPSPFFPYRPLPRLSHGEPATG
jgi:myb proto-oncogene protein